MVQLSGMHLNGCAACYACFKKKDKRCAVTEDAMNDLISKMVEADGILLGSPTYFADITSDLKAVIERAGFVAKANSDMFKRKVGAAVVAVRRGGEIHAFDSINHFFLISQMVVPGSIYWNMGFGLDKGDVERDEEGIRTMVNLGRNMAWVLKKLTA
jgi:multimeric flavodoxin WrbA